MARNKHVVVYFNEEEYTRLTEIVTALEDIEWSNQRSELHQKFLKGVQGAPLTLGVFIRTASISMCDFFQQYSKQKRLSGDNK